MRDRVVKLCALINLLAFIICWVLVASTARWALPWVDSAILNTLTSVVVVVVSFFGAGLLVERWLSWLVNVCVMRLVPEQRGDDDRRR